DFCGGESCRELFAGKRVGDSANVESEVSLLEKLRKLQASILGRGRHGTKQQKQKSNEAAVSNSSQLGIGLGVCFASWVGVFVERLRVLIQQLNADLRTNQPILYLLLDELFHAALQVV